MCPNTYIQYTQTHTDIHNNIHADTPMPEITHIYT